VDAASAPGPREAIKIPVNEIVVVIHWTEDLHRGVIHNQRKDAAVAAGLPNADAS
jgi:hypothetical protein